jgi:hypothetical protein
MNEQSDLRVEDFYFKLVEEVEDDFRLYQCSLSSVERSILLIWEVEQGWRACFSLGEGRLDKLPGPFTGEWKRSPEGALIDLRETMVDVAEERRGKLQRAEKLLGSIS